MGKIEALFLDIGGVLLTNGWDRKGRMEAAKRFHIDFKDLNNRHMEIFYTYEVGKTSLKEYLDQVVFYKKRKFTYSKFKSFMFSRSKSYPKMIELICDLKKKYCLKIVVVSNEGRELNAFRIKTFQLNSFVDFFISSSYVHLRKPDQDMYQLALDVSQVAPSKVLYIDDRPMLVQVAKNMGIHSICHSSFESTKKALAGYHLT